MTNIENDTPIDDGQTSETGAAEAVAPAQGDNEELAQLAEQLAAVQQDVLYARAETQNVRRRAEKDVADAHAYAATKFARDILSVADNLGRALAALSEEQRADDAI
jgi:molecular chaperone GrpE